MKIRRLFVYTIVTVILIAVFFYAISYSTVSTAQQISIYDQLNWDQYLTSIQKNQIKSKEYEKIAQIQKTPRQKYFLEIKDIKSVSNQIQFLVRAWDKNNKLIGFGQDGTVEWERFIVVNPPILVRDSNGSIYIPERGNFTENLTEALLQIVESSIDVKKQKFDDTKIIKDKIGSTTTTVYPDPDPESTSVDGYIAYQDLAGVTWATIQSATDGTTHSDTSTLSAQIRADGNTDKWDLFRRTQILFDTSTVPGNVDSATLSIWFTVKVDNFTSNVDIDHVSPASNTDLVDADYDQFDSVRQATGIALSSITTGQYTDFSLNATGLSNVDTAGISKFGYRISQDLDNSEPVWASGQESIVNAHGSEDVAGTTEDTKLVIESSEAAASTSGTATSTPLTNYNFMFGFGTFVFLFAAQFIYFVMTSRK